MRAAVPLPQTLPRGPPADVVSPTGHAIKVEAWHRRQALMIASQLPEDYDDALAVLCAAIDLMKDFVHGDQREPERKPAPVISN